MEGRGKEKEWKSVPQFGAWDQKGEVSPNYSMVFGQPRAHRKQAKMDVKQLGLKNELIFTAPQNPHVHQNHDHQNAHQNDSTSTKKNKIMAYCCIMPY